MYLDPQVGINLSILVYLDPQVGIDGLCDVTRILCCEGTNERIWVRT